MSAETLKPNEFEEIPGRLRIGVDLDGVVADIFTWIARLYKRKFNYDLRKTPGPVEYQIGNRPDVLATPYGKEFCHYLLETDFLYQNAHLIKGAAEYLNLWRRQGHQLLFITARSHRRQNLTEDWLAGRGLDWVGVSYRTSGEKVEDYKAKVVREGRFHIMIDDHGPTIASLNSQSLLVKIAPRYSWNEAEDLGGGIFCQNWKQTNQMVQTASYIHYLRHSPPPCYTKK